MQEAYRNCKTNGKSSKFLFYGVVGNNDEVGLPHCEPALGDICTYPTDGKWAQVIQLGKVKNLSLLAKHNE